MKIYLFCHPRLVSHQPEESHTFVHMNNTDFEVFTEEIEWFLQPGDKTDITGSTPAISETFSSTFPTLAALLAQASVLDITLTRKKKTMQYKLFTWTNSEGAKSGWLGKMDEGKAIALLPAHQLLVDTIGGIEHSYTQVGSEVPLLTDNQNFLFSKSQCKQGMEDWMVLYDQVCEQDNIQKLDTSNLICFAVEANGNETFYDLKTGQVLLFAPDHDFDNVIVYDGQAEYTFYTINEVPGFVDYVELLAKQWRDMVSH